jgi:hypothetical protein
VVVRAADGALYYAPSVWKDAKGVAVPAPLALSFANADGEAVFDAEGDTEDTGRSIKMAPVHRAPGRDSEPPPSSP